MRILYLPLMALGGASEQIDLAAAFWEVADLEVLDYLNIGIDPNVVLRRTFEEFRPDIVHGQYQGSNIISTGVLETLKRDNPDAWFTQWSGDVRPEPIREIVEKGRVCDTTLLSAGGQCAMYDAAIGRQCCRYWQNAVGERFFVEPVPIEERRGIIFCGSHYGTFPATQERFNMVMALRSQFPDEAVVYGHNWPWGSMPIPWERQPEVYRRARMTIGHNHLNDVRWYWSDRQLICMAAGVPHLARYTPGMEDWFEDGADCLSWCNLSELRWQIEWVFANPEEAAAIGLNGQRRVREEHHWRKRVQEYLDMYEERAN